VDASVVDRLDPRAEQAVHLAQAVDALAGGLVELDQELVPHCSKEALDLASALGAVRGGVDQLDAERRAGPQQPGVHERGAVVHVDAFRDAAGGERRPQGGGQADGVLGETEPVADHGPALVVDESEQIRFAAADPRPVERVPGPKLVRVPGLEPAEDLPAGGGQVQARSAKCRCSVRSVGAQPALCRRIRRIWAAVRSSFSFFNATASSSSSGGVRGTHLRGVGASAAKPLAPVPDPPVQRPPGHGDPPAERVGVLGPGDPPTQSAALPRGQRRVDQLLDQRIPKQGHLPGLLRPAAVLLLEGLHAASTLPSGS
jgi:hypothetical protein